MEKEKCEHGRIRDEQYCRACAEGYMDVTANLQTEQYEKEVKTNASANDGRTIITVTEQEV